MLHCHTDSGALRKCVVPFLEPDLNCGCMKEGVLHVQIVVDIVYTLFNQLRRCITLNDWN